MTGTQTAAKIQDKEKLATMVGRPDTKLLDLQEYFTNRSKLEKRHFAPHSKRNKGIHRKQEFSHQQWKTEMEEVPWKTEPKKKKHPYMSLPALAHKFATDLDSNKCP
jgi:hypothetical protein